MPDNRYFSDEEFTEGGQITLEEGEHAHLSKAMRKGKGATVQLVNGRGALAEATVDELGKRQTKLTVQNVVKSPPHQVQRILIQALPRLNRLDTIIEKTTELGVDQIWLFPGERSEKKELSAQQIRRTHQLRVAALKQCGRLYLPHLEIKPALSKWEHLPSPTYFGDISPQAPVFQQVWQPPKAEIAFVVGPESGLTEAESLHLQRLGAHGVCLHPLILRTDTASITALSLITHWLI